MTAVKWLLMALLCAAYLLAATITWRRAAWVFADKARFDRTQRFTSFEIIWGLLVGAAFAAIWPLTLTIWLSSKRGVAYLGSRFLLPPPEVRGERRAQDAAEQGRRIAELERLMETADR